MHFHSQICTGIESVTSARDALVRRPRSDRVVLLVDGVAA